LTLTDHDRCKYGVLKYHYVYRDDVVEANHAQKKKSPELGRDLHSVPDPTTLFLPGFFARIVKARWPRARHPHPILMHLSNQLRCVLLFPPLHRQKKKTLYKTAETRRDRLKNHDMPRLFFFFQSEDHVVIYW